MRAGERNTIDTLIEECADTAQNALLGTLEALRSPLPASKFLQVTQMQNLSQEVLHHLELANQAGSDGDTILAEEGYHRAINLMVELRTCSGAAGLSSGTEAVSA